MIPEMRNYYSYFIIDPERKVVFIDVSYAKDAPAILRKHLRGEVPETAGVFGPDVEQVGTMLHKCTPKYRTKKDAKEEAVGWHHYFVSKGYRIIRSDDSDDLPPLSYHTENMLKKIKCRAVSEVIFTQDSRNYFSEATGKKVSALHKHTIEPASVVLSFRVPPSVADAFASLAEASEYSKGQLFAALIDEYTGYTRHLESDLAGRLKRLDASIAATQKAHNSQKAALEKTIHRLEAQHSITQGAVAAAVKLWFWRNRPVGNIIPVYSRKQARRYFRDRFTYPYPSEGGISLIEVEHLCYGRSRKNRGQVMFLYGHEVVSGKKLKLRCYFRKGLVGRHPRMDEYRNDSVWWQVGYEPVQDGAVDLVCSIPIPHTAQQAVLPQPKTSYRDYLRKEELTQKFPGDPEEPQAPSHSEPPAPQTGFDALLNSAEQRAAASAKAK